MARKPDFFIIGAMKCATSSLHEQLAAQPGIFMSTPKEPNFFSDDEQYVKGVGWYYALFRGAAPEALCGESSTHYTKLPRHPRTIERLEKHIHDGKFIYIMRHPIDRLVSHYVHEWTQRVLDEPIDEAIVTHRALVQFSQYAMQLEPWFDHFGRDRVLPVFFDRLRAHPQEELERIARFIGYEGQPRWQDLDASNVSSQRMRTSWARDLIVNAPVVSTIRRKMIPQVVRDKIKSLWTMRERPSLSEAARRGLQEQFDPDLAKLGGWLGIELNCANFVEATRDQSLRWVVAADHDGPQTESAV